MLADFERAYVCKRNGGVATLAYMVERANGDHRRPVGHEGADWIDDICHLLRTRRVKCSQWLMSSLKKPEHKQAIVKAIILMQLEEKNG